MDTVDHSIKKEDIIQSNQDITECIIPVSEKQDEEGKSTPFQVS